MPTQPVLQINGGEVKLIRSQLHSHGLAVDLTRGGRFDMQESELIGQPAFAGRQSNAFFAGGTVTGGLHMADGTLHATEMEFLGDGRLQFDRVVWLVWRNVQAKESTVSFQDCIAPVLTDVEVDAERWHCSGDRDPNWQWRLAHQTDVTP